MASSDQPDWQAMGFATRAIHAGQPADPTTGATTFPIYQTSTFTQAALGEHKGFEYSRSGNPTRAALEACLASIEGAQFGLAFASGLAAEMCILSTLRPDDHIVACDDLYGGSFRLFEKVLRPMGIDVSFVPAREITAYGPAATPRTKLYWIETPTNPLLNLIDIHAVAEVAHSRGAKLVADNTFATPCAQQPLALGADLVVHSTTKYINGHSDVVGGAIMTSDEELLQSLAFYQNAAGGVPSPFDCWLTMRGIKTLAVRMRQHQENALAVAEFLEHHPRVRAVFYPGLPSHPDYQLARDQMCNFGGMVSFELKGALASVRKFVRRLRVFALAESLGGVESLCCHPASMTHASIPAQIREARGVTDSLLRLSVGIEDPKDLIADLQQALE
jgi:cystathionine gamma-lyase